MIRHKHVILFTLILLILQCTIPYPAAANSAEPPSLIIVVDDPKRTTQMILYDGEAPIDARVSDTAWERQFRFFKLDISKNIRYRLVVTTPDETHEITIPQLVKQYRTTYKLNTDTGELSEGLPPWRSAILVSLRFTFTVLIEGLVFYLFLFRQKASWIRFILINILTQGALNLWLNDLSHMEGYLIFALVIGESFVFAAEAVLYAAFIKEHSMVRRMACVFAANAASLVLGGFLLYWLPI